MKRLLFIISVQMLGLANLSAQVFDYVVAKDNSGDFQTVQEAINACPDNERKVIFVKAGKYEEKVMIGSHSKASNKLLSIIGEDPEKVIITWDDYNKKTIIYDGKQVTSGTPQSATFTVNAVDFYAENLTIENSYSKAQAVALYNVGDRQTFKNCRLIGYQDTHYLKKTKRSYFYDCYIEGGTDYICAGGTAIFDNCQLHSVRNGSYITAPEDISAMAFGDDKVYFYGFIFRNCLLTTEAGYEVFLGRPWQGKSSSVFLSCKMDGVKSAGWSTWDGNNHLTSFFAEYNSTDRDGNPIDVANRVEWSHQLTKQEVDTYYTNEKIYSFTTGDYDPFSLVKSPKNPTSVTLSSGTLSWTEVAGAKGYIVYKNDQIIGLTEATSFVVDSNDKDVFTIKIVGAHGNLSNKIAEGEYSSIANKNTSERAIYFRNGTLFVPENKKTDLYTLTGALISRTYGETGINLSETKTGVCIVRVEIENGNIITVKVVL
ncbi:pectinesterase family protein [Dysgonomonas sp. 520]|uniref:pectinesterase family protein n=1 Tax=Dysgonomonas sp. 520 TaxID=2302931 RepID=UPI0013D20DCB|nr:pectinesterase family protein [Dysgonomonas sp. 520]NDW09682.1 hypothetical protein [Dysgonomonas sp. 520]